MAEQRARWHEQLAREPVTGLVFVDESGANTQMTRWRGRALGGQRLVAHVPHGSYQTSTLISGIRWEGPCAPWLFEGPMNGEMFLAWVEQGLAPTLRAGDLVILDNLATHKIRGVREAIQSRGARLLYLPPYSPDFNPIEPMWSKIKQILRSHAPRTETELLAAAKAAFQAIYGDKLRAVWEPKGPVNLFDGDKPAGELPDPDVDAKAEIFRNAARVHRGVAVEHRRGVSRARPCARPRREFPSVPVAPGAGGST